MVQFGWNLVHNRTNDGDDDSDDDDVLYLHTHGP